MITLDGSSLTLDAIQSVLDGDSVSISPAVIEHISSTRTLLDKMLMDEKPHYGINTGFGALATTKIPSDDLAKLQLNLIRSHAVGVGEPLSFEESRILLLLRANTLSKGHSGCRPIILKYLTQLLSSGCAGYIPCKGSVGASGDLAPLAHQALLLLGEGKAMVDGELVQASHALKHADLKPIQLEAKEGLALINGTQAMCARGCKQLLSSIQLMQLADQVGAMTTDALLGSQKAFDPRIQKIRNHPGQQTSAKIIGGMLKGSELLASHQNCKQVQDPYSIRCMPQVHGATRDVIQHVQDVLEREINAATDNPLLFIRDDKLDIISGGNFHGQPIALALDYLCMAMSELANISDRRMELMLDPHKSRGLPAFLTPNPGLNSGFMMLQVTAAALISENKILCHPASVDSIPTSAGQEDHVSMGMTSANKLKTVVDNVRTVLSIELMCAAQAIDLRKPITTSNQISRLQQKVREMVDFAEEDRNFGVDLQILVSAIEQKSMFRSPGIWSGGVTPHPKLNIPYFPIVS